METKRTQAIRHLDGKGSLPIVEVFYEFNHLKALYRQGWLHHGVPKEHCETVAEHSMGVALLALFLADEYFPELDKGRLILMGLLHDFGEIYAGDIVPGKISLEEKHALERKSVERVFLRLPKGREYLAIWEEFEAQATPAVRDRAEVVDGVELTVGLMRVVHARDPEAQLETQRRVVAQHAGHGGQVRTLDEDRHLGWVRCR